MRASSAGRTTGSPRAEFPLTYQQGKAERAGCGRPVKFATSIVPAAATLAEARALVREANAACVDMIRIEDTQGRSIAALVV